MGSWGRLVAILPFIYSVSTYGADCPLPLQKLKSQYLKDETLCQVFNRYENALKKLESQGLTPAERVGNLLAPRFINLPDWLAKRTNGIRAPWEIYSPAPLTWIQWERGAAFVDGEVIMTRRSGQFNMLSLKWLKAAHETTMKVLIDATGLVRTFDEIGMSLNRQWGLTPMQAKGIRSVIAEMKAEKYPLSIRYTVTQCLEERSAEFQERFRKLGSFLRSEWPAQDNDHYFEYPDGEVRQCGYIDYPEPSLVGPQLNLWVDEINRVLRAWNAGDFKIENDPIAVAARAQRWFILIHPFVRGNGRMSRFVMEWILRGVGLPAPILDDMNNDLYSTEEQWKTKVGEGILRAVSEAEACAKTPAAIGCTPVEEIIYDEN